MSSRNRLVVLISIFCLAFPMLCFAAAPHVDSVSPTTAIAGTEVTITGTGFQTTQGTGLVRLGTAYGVVTSWSDTQIVATVASGSKTGTAAVYQGGVWSATTPFTVITPVVTSVTPTTGVAGTEVTIVGTGFQATQGTGLIRLGTAYGKITSWSDTQIVATVASGSKTGTAAVYQGGVWSATTPFTVITPVVSSVTPTTGVAGTEVTIVGTGFQAAQGTGLVRLGTAYGKITSWSDTQIVATIASGSKTGTAAVYQGGVWSATAPFTVVTPVVTSVTPTTGVSGTEVTITGTGFQAAQGAGLVRLGTAYGAVKSWSDTQIIATVASGSKTGTAAVYQGGVWSDTTPFTVITPVVASVTPTTGVAGSEVTIVGTGFQATQGTGLVRLGTAYGKITSWSDTQIVATIASGSKTGTAAVYQGGVWSATTPFTVITPVVTSVTPTTGVAGTEVTITGTGFQATQGTGLVRLGTAYGKITSWSDTQIVATIASGSKTGTAAVYQGGVWSDTTPFTVITPVLSSVTPLTGVAGTTVTITGTGFQATQGTGLVRLGTAYGKITSWSDTQIVATIASGSKTGTAAVYQGGVWTDATPFTVITPVVSTVSATTVVAGADVTITGTGFQATQGAGLVRLGTAYAKIKSWSDTQIVATVATASKTGTAAVYQGGVWSDTTPFTIVVAPTLTAVSPITGIVGTAVTLTGSNFGDTQGASTVTLNGAAATVASWSNTQISVTVPSSATSGNVVVAIAGAVASNAKTFTVLQPPTISSISPMSGPVGTSVTIAGANFGTTQGATTVTFNGANAAATSWNDSQIVVAVPTTATTGDVVVTANGITSNASLFTVNASTPLLQLQVNDTPVALTLSDPINLDWVAWGADGTTTASTRKGGANLISDFVPIGQAGIQADLYSYIPLTWSGGTPIADGNSVYSEITSRTIGSGFQVTAPADKTVKTLDIHFQLSGRAQIEATLSDGSSAPITDSSVYAGSETNKTYSIDYRAGSTGQTITVKLTLIEAGDSGVIGLEAATLRSHVPELTVQLPQSGELFASGAQIPVVVDVKQWDASISNVDLLANGTNLYSWTASPFSAVFTPPSTGHYKLQANAKDTTGLSNSSAVREVDVLGTGGSLSVSLGTQSDSVDVDLTTEGTADWVMFARYSDFLSANPRKAAVLPLISELRQIGNHGFWNGTCCSPWYFNFTDGTPTSIASSESPYTYVDGVGNGAEFTVRADTTPRMLRLFATASYGRAKLQAYLSDGSAAPVTDVSLDTNDSSTSWQHDVYEISYNAASDNQTLTVRLTLEKEYDWGELGISAATLTGDPVAPPPHVNSLVPSTGVEGDHIQIQGYSFDSGTGAPTVTLNGISAAVTGWTANVIDLVVPPNVRTGPVQVINDLGSSNADVVLTIKPQIATMSPESGIVSTTVILTGKGFGDVQSSSYVTFNNITAIPSSWSDTQIVVSVPDTATTGEVVVVSGSVTSNAPTFTVLGGTTNSAVLSLRSGSVPPIVNLSDPVNLDWAIWGADGSTPSMTRKSGTADNLRISNFSPLLGSQTTGGDDWGAQPFVWNGGTPIATGDEVSAQVYTSTYGGGFRITVPADTTVKTLRLYAGLFNGASLNISLSDGSRPAISQSIVPKSQYLFDQREFVIDFRAASVGQTLTIDWMSTDYWGSVVLQAATLEPHLPEIAILSPQDEEDFAYPTTVSVGINAMQFDTDPVVQVQGTGTQLSAIQAPPYLWNWTPTPGHYKLQGFATDAAGLVGTSDPVEVNVIGSGGALSASLRTDVPTEIDLTEDGTRDWIFFTPREQWANWETYDSDGTSTGVIHKANVSQLISTASTIGTSEAGTRCFGPEFGFSDGTPVEEEASVACGLAQSTKKSGFEFSVPADTTSRELQLYVGIENGKGKLVAFLSDGSAFSVLNKDLSADCTSKNGFYRINFKSASPDQTLTVRWIMEEMGEPNCIDYILYPSLNLYAATLDGEPVPQAPTINSVQPASGLPGTTVTITGSHFGPLQQTGGVKFGTVSANILDWSDSEIVVLVPAGAQTAPITITAATSLTVSHDFTVLSQPVIDPTSIGIVVGDSNIAHLVDVTSGAVLSGASWKISNTSVATVSSGDTVTITGQKPGTTTLSATWNGVTVTSAVQVVAASAGDVAEPTPVTGVTPSTTTVTDSLGNKTTYTFSYIGGKILLTDVVGSGCSTCSYRGESHSGYDERGRRVMYKDALGHTTYSSYDDSGNLLASAVAADGGRATTTYTYNGFSEVLTVTDPLGSTTTNAYDANGNLVSVTSPDPGGDAAPSVTRFAYDTKGQLTSITDPLGNTTTLTYTPVGLISSITDAQQNITSYEYDVRGNRTAVVDAMQQRTVYAYDSGSRLTSITYPDSTVSKFGYDYRGRRTSVTDQNGKVTTYTYDDAGRLLSVTDAAKNTTTYSYDTEGNLLTLTDAKGNPTTFAYDAFGRATQTTFPSSLIEQYVYDALGNLTSKTDRKGQAITYIYDTLNRLTQKQYPDATTTDYVYDLVGKLKLVTDPTGTYAFAYDNMGRLIGTTTQYTFLPGKTLSNSYTYDASSHRKTLTTDGSTVSYTYDSLSRLTNLTSSWAGSFGFGYDNLNRRTSLTRPNNVNTGYSYDSVSRLLNVLHQAGGVNVDGAGYSYDNAGNRTSKKNYITNVTDSYGYDSIYQLLNVTSGGVASESYSYDAVGNRLGSIIASGWLYNASNQLTSNGTAAFTYDNNGNMLAKTETSGASSFAWDVDNRLTQVILPNDGGNVNFRYDPFGRRILKSSLAGATIYSYDGANIVAEYSSAGALTAKYTQGTGIDEPLAMMRDGAVSYYHADGLGSITSLTDALGSAVAAYRTDAFGKSIQTAGTITNPFRYTGREWDSETNLYYYRARYYDPNIGRFTSEDPIGFRGGGNFYRYALDNPVRFRDQSGLTVHCYWGIDAGHLVCYDDGTGKQVVNVTGYAGGNEGKAPGCVNDTSCVDSEDEGALPYGDYRIGADNGRMGPLSLPLTPKPGTPSMGRPGGYYMHGCKRKGEVCSQGCIVVPLDARNTINNSGGGTLMVSPGDVEAPSGNYCQGGVCRL